MMILWKGIIIISTIENMERKIIFTRIRRWKNSQRSEKIPGLKMCSIRIISGMTRRWLIWICIMLMENTGYWQLVFPLPTGRSTCMIWMQPVLVKKLKRRYVPLSIHLIFPAGWVWTRWAWQLVIFTGKPCSLPEAIKFIK